jgi:fumarylpyruvate hydrolase
MKYAIPPPPITTLPLSTTSTTVTAHADVAFPVNRIYCVGRNYPDHAVEMGGDPEKEPPFFFSKPRDAIVFCGISPSDDIIGRTPTAATISIPYPLATSNLHHEIKLVVAIGKEGVEIPLAQADDYIFGYAVGVDLTRRDMQTLAKKTGRPWDCSKGFDRSAPVGLLYPKTTKYSALLSSSIWLMVNGTQRQSCHLNRMTWSVPEIVSALSHQFQLVPGDLIMTGTPSGVGPLEVGDVVTGGIDGFGQVAFRIVGR